MRTEDHQQDMISSKTHRAKKMSREMPNTLKLPRVPQANESTLASKRAAGITGEKKAPGVDVSLLSQHEAMTLLRKYNITRDEGEYSAIGFSRVKMSTRSGWVKHEPVRTRITSKSLDKVDRPPQYFTEGLSSLSKCKEQTLAMHRRDIIGANMPETIRLAREGSRISFGVNHYRPKKLKNGMKAHRIKALQIVRESGAVTANQIVAPLAAPRTLPVESAWEELSAKQESRITRLLKTMEKRYGREVVAQALPSTPSVQSDFLAVSTAGNSPQMTPRKTSVKQSKPNLSIVSLGDSLLKLPERRKLGPHIIRPTKDDQYNELERFKQHSYEKNTYNSEMKFRNRQARENVVQYPFIGKLRSYLERKLKTKPTRKKLQIVVSLKYGTESSENDKDSDEKSDSSPRPDGTFQVEGVKGIGAVDRLWSASSVSTSTSVVNPPPSVEVSLYDMEFPHVTDPAAIFNMNDKVSELATNGFAAHDGEFSDRNSIASSLLSVPCQHSIEKRPPLRDGQGSLEQDTSSPSSEKEADVPQGNEGGVNCPSISISDIAAVQEDLQEKEHALQNNPQQTNGDGDDKLEHSAREEVESKRNDGEQLHPRLQHNRMSQEIQKVDHQDVGSASGPLDGYPNSSSVHSQSIVFISPLDVQPNAKRQ